jgi:hypothetical protein
MNESQRDRYGSIQALPTASKKDWKRR